MAFRGDIFIGYSWVSFQYLVFCREMYSINFESHLINDFHLSVEKYSNASFCT